MAGMEDAKEGLYDGEGIAASPDLCAGVLDACSLEDLMNDGATAKTKADWARTKEETGGAKLGVDGRPERTVLEAVDVVDAAEGAGVGTVSCDGGLCVLGFSTAYETRTVADDDEGVHGGNLALARLLGDTTHDERVDVETAAGVGHGGEGGTAGCVVVAVVVEDVFVWVALWVCEGGVAVGSVGVEGFGHACPLEDGGVVAGDETIGGAMGTGKGAGVGDVEEGVVLSEVGEGVSVVSERGSLLEREPFARRNGVSSNGERASWWTAKGHEGSSTKAKVKVAGGCL